MKKLITALALLLLFTSNSCEEEVNACNCKDYHEKEISYPTPLIEFHVTYTGIGLAKFLDSYMEFGSKSFREKIRLHKNWNDEYMYSPSIGYAEAADTSEITQSLQSFAEENNLDSTNIQFIWSKKEIKFIDNDTTYHTLYALKPNTKSEISITNKDLSSARKTISPYDGNIFVIISFDEKGVEKLHKYSTKNVGNFITISSHNKVLSAPQISAPISGGETLITGKFTSEEADSLSDWINCDAYARRIGQDAFEKELADCIKKD